jgi:serine/threonine-protein kinase
MSESTLSPEELERVDSACDRFEAAWRSGQRTELKSFVEDLETPVGRVLLRELLKVELAYRVQRGEQPTAQEYQALFPEHANLVAAIFGEAMDQRNRSQGTTTPHTQPNDDSAVARDSPPPSGWIGRYQVMGRIGAGGMGTVYKAHDPQLDRIVALKMPRFDGSGQSQAMRKQRFQREARAAAQVRHANVCPV